VHQAAVSVELAALTRLDARGRELPSPEEGRSLADRVTMVVKTFERPDVVRRLVRTARIVFPGRILVADDSETPLNSLGPSVDIVALPFNVGLSAGRNAAVAQVTTEFTFLTDDDIVFTAATDIVAMMEYLDAHPDVDLVAPQLVNLPWLYATDRRQSALFDGALPPRRPFGEEIDGAVVVPKVANVFLARTEPLRRIGWDEQLRLVEHRDFFTRASGRLVCVQADGVRAYHVRTPYDDEYMRYRRDTRESLAYLGKKWSGARVDGVDDGSEER
jgi:hypothetical protein